MNRIAAVAGGCGLLESWTGRSGMVGTSLNYFSEGRWHQVWTDSSGTVLRLSGGWEDGRMLLRGPSAVAGELHEVAWTPLPDGGVRQVWRASKDGGAQWQTLFEGLYRRLPAT